MVIDRPGSGIAGNGREAGIVAIGVVLPPADPAGGEIGNHFSVGGE